MVNRNLLRQFDLSDEELDSQFTEEQWLPTDETTIEVNKIVTGKVLNVVGDEVWVDVNYKSEGVIPLNEWYDEGVDKVVPPKVGDKIQVLVDAGEDELGSI